MKRTNASSETSRTSNLGLLLSRSEDDFYGSLQRAHNEVIQPPVETKQEEPIIYSFQPVDHSSNCLGSARLAIHFF